MPHREIAIMWSWVVDKSLNDAKGKVFVVQSRRASRDRQVKMLVEGTGTCEEGCALPASLMQTAACKGFRGQAAGR